MDDCPASAMLYRQQVLCVSLLISEDDVVDALADIYYHVIKSAEGTRRSQLPRSIECMRADTPDQQTVETPVPVRVETTVKYREQNCRELYQEKVVIVSMIFNSAIRKKESR